MIPVEALQRRPVHASFFQAKKERQARYEMAARQHLESKRPPVEPAPVVVEEAPAEKPTFRPWFWITDEITPPRKRPLIETVQRATAAHYNVSRREMLTARRARDVMHPRQAAYYLAKKLTKATLPEIGRAFNRDHSSVLHGVRKIERLMETDATLLADLHAIANALGFDLNKEGDV
jgi:hypothetical protein